MPWGLCSSSAISGRRCRLFAPAGRQAQPDESRRCQTEVKLFQASQVTCWILDSLHCVHAAMPALPVYHGSEVHNLVLAYLPPLDVWEDYF